jgi:hypothetical protein
VNVLRHKLLWINGRKPKDGMYPSDEKLRINVYGAISLGFVTKPSERRLNNKEITEIINLNINNKHKIRVRVRTYHIRSNTEYKDFIFFFFFNKSIHKHKAKYLIGA